MDATCVVFVPRNSRRQMRQVLHTMDLSALRWGERKGLLRSEFHFTGPADTALRVQGLLTEALAQPRLAG